MSEPQTLARAILISTAPGSGSGTGYSRISNGVPVPWKTASRAVSGIAVSSLIPLAEEGEGAGGVRDGHRRGGPEVARVQRGKPRDAEEAQSDPHLVLQQLEGADEPGRRRGGEAAAGQAPETHDIGAERDGLDDVGPTRVAAVHEDGGAAAHRGHDLGQHLGASRAVVE